MLTGFFGEVQERLQGYTNMAELKKAVFNSGTYGLLVGLGVYIVGSIAANADQIFPNAPVVSGLVVMIAGMIISQLRSMSFGKVVLPVSNNAVVPVSQNAPVAVLPPDTPVKVLESPKVNQAEFWIAPDVSPEARERVAREFQQALKGNPGQSVVLNIRGEQPKSADDCTFEEVILSGKKWYRDPWTGAAFESEAAFFAWCDSGHDLKQVPGGWFIDDNKQFVYTAKSGEAIHYETRTDDEGSPVPTSEGEPTRFTGVDGGSGR